MGNVSKTDAQGHRLVNEWKEYRRCEEKDLPASAAEALEVVIKVATEKKYAWDFYDGWCKYADVRSRRSWKERNALEKEFAAAVEQYGDPIVRYAFEASRGSVNAAWAEAFLSSEGNRLKQSQNESFYRFCGSTPGMLSGNLYKYISNDYEYVLWDMTARNTGPSQCDSLRSELGGKYPAAAFLDFLVADRDSDPSVMEELVRKYDGTAVGLMARMRMLSHRFSELSSSGKATASDYELFYEDCKSAEAFRKSLRGEEKAMAGELTTARDFMDELSRQSISVSAGEEGIEIVLNNLSSTTLSVRPCEGRGKSILTRKVKVDNPHFYVGDTVRVDAPWKDDGEYVVTVRSGRTEAVSDVSVSRLSAAVRLAGNNLGIYVAESRTGRPLEKVDLTLLKGDRELVSVRDVPAGQQFAPLPEELLKAVRDRSALYWIQCSARDSAGFLLKSRKVRVPFRHYRADIHDSGVCCMVMTDRGAYNPGDTIRFKGIFYRGNITGSIRVCGTGKMAKAALHDSEDNVIASAELKVSAFGSVAGEFSIPEDLRGGMFTVEVSCGEDSGSAFVRVDEFVAPTFRIGFQPVEGLCRPGDEIVVKGMAESFTGHGLAGMKLSYKVVKYGRVFAEGAVSPDHDGAFSLRFASSPEDRWAHYKVTVTALGPTGETLDFSTWVRVSDRIDLDIDVEGTSDAMFKVRDEDDGYRYVPDYLVEGESAVVRFKVTSQEGTLLDSDVRYKVSDEAGKLLTEGIVKSGEPLDLSSAEGSMFVIKADVSTGGYDPLEDSLECRIFKVGRDAKVLDVPFEYYFRPSGGQVEEGGRICATFGTASGPLWAVVELTGEDAEVLERRAVCLDGARGREGSLTVIDFNYRREYPDAVRMNVFYFRGGRSESISSQFVRARHNLDLPLAFSRFEDRTVPGTEYTFGIRTAPGVECLAAVYDKALDAFMPNEWRPVRLAQMSVDAPLMHVGCGEVLYDESRRNYAMPKRSVRKMVGRSMASNEMMAFDAVEEEAAPMMSFDKGAGSQPDGLDDASDILERAALRSDFASTIAFEPFLKSDANGDISFRFRTSDKLGTYYVALFAHDRDMRNDVLRREMVVTVPVKVSLQEPRFLYEGDRCVLSIVVSNSSPSEVCGVLTVGVSPKGEKGSTKAENHRIAVAAGGDAVVKFDLGEIARDIVIKAVFTSDGGVSDGLQVSVPVLSARQQVREAHSAVLLAGGDEEALLGRLRGEFVNGSAHGAKVSRISVMDMVREALPSKVEAAGPDVVSLSEAWYVRRTAERLGVQIVREESDNALMDRIMACRNGDGGFAWFAGMDSNPQVTALVLERFARTDISLRRVSEPGSWVYGAVRYLDRAQFGASRPVWFGALSDERYMRVRSMFASVPFSVEAAPGHKKESDARMKEFRRFAAGYLVPSGDRGLQGDVAGKVMRLTTLDNLLASGDGLSLAGAWGAVGLTRSLAASVRADVESLLEYAVEHPSGGVYYPNLVMPLRGLLESEAGEHAHLADLMAAHGGENPRCREVADGIRLWLMLQKETQKWDESSAFVDAIASVLEASGGVRETRVIVMEKAFEKPLEGVEAAGNGMKIGRRFFREVSRVDGDGVLGSVSEEIAPGTVLRVGERIRAEYRVWSGENRSFVRLTAPREASLRPVDQLSGYCRFGVSPLRLDGWYMIRMSGYRDVRSDVTSYYFDAFPEEDTVISEEFFVTQEGEFSAPAVQIECLYAPHYRANDASPARMRVGEQ
ncbi:MAG: MG2 domain-containing protein [Candidatus Cryptobacteroides sp.]